MRGTVQRTAVMLTGGGVALALLAGCGGTADPSTGEPSGPASTGTAEDGPVTVDVTVNNSQVNASEDRIAVDIGDEVRLNVTIDEDDYIHVHGIEEILVLDSGEEGTLDFTVPAGVPRGVHRVEAHSSGVTLLEIRVR